MPPTIYHHHYLISEMNSLIKIFLSIAITLLNSISVLAQEESRPVTQQYRLELGSGSAISTYLSPLRYTGSSYSFSGQWSKAFQKNPEHVVMQFNGAMTWRNMENPAKTASMIGLDAYFGWGIGFRQRFPNGLQITAGGSIDINGGCLYLIRNGNNPVTALASAGFDINASVSYKFNIGRLPVLVSDEIRLPAINAFFSPEYGETYYEIYLGNHKGLAHCGWWGNRFGIDNLLSIKLDFGRTAMEIGYRYDLQTYWANQLNTKVSAHRFVIGVIPHGLGLKKREKNVNYSLY